MKKTEVIKTMWYAGCPRGNALLFQLDVTSETKFVWRCEAHPNVFKKVFTKDERELHDTFAEAQHAALVFAATQVTATKIKYETAKATLDIIAAKKEPKGGILIATEEMGVSVD